MTLRQMINQNGFIPSEDRWFEGFMGYRDGATAARIAKDREEYGEAFEALLDKKLDDCGIVFCADNCCYYSIVDIGDGLEIVSDEDRDALIRNLLAVGEIYDDASRGLAAYWAKEKLDKYAEATRFLRFSPRGFANEITLYAVKKGELPAAKKWIQSVWNSQASTNARWDVLTPKEVRDILATSIYAERSDNPADKQTATAKRIDGWWYDVKKLYESEDWDAIQVFEQQLAETE